MSILKLYKASDDSLIPASPSESNTIEFTLDPSIEESGEIRVYAKTDLGYKTTTTAVVLSGTNVARWQRAPDSSGSAGVYDAGDVSMSLGTVTNAVPVYFWVKATSLNTEGFQKDTTVTLTLTGTGEVD